MKKSLRCKWCNERGNEQFCCQEHQNLYQRFRYAISIVIESEKIKKQKSEKELKTYRKVQDYLTVNRINP